MCGIVGYVGSRSVSELLVEGLHRLEYRGYDSAGIAIINNGLAVFKKAGKVKALRKLINENESTNRLFTLSKNEPSLRDVIAAQIPEESA